MWGSHRQCSCISFWAEMETAFNVQPWEISTTYITDAWPPSWYFTMTVLLVTFPMMIEKHFQFVYLLIYSVVKQLTRLVPTFSKFWRFITPWELQSHSHAFLKPGFKFSADPHMSTLLLVTDIVTARSTSSDLALKSRASSLGTTKTGLEVRHPLSRFPQVDKWVFTASAQLCMTQNWVLYHPVGEHCASKNDYITDTASTRQVSFLPFHTAALLQLLVESIRASEFVFSYGLYIWEYCFPEASRMCS